MRFLEKYRHFVAYTFFSGIFLKKHVRRILKVCGNEKAPMYKPNTELTRPSDIKHNAKVNDLRSIRVI